METDDAMEEGRNGRHPHEDGTMSKAMETEAAQIGTDDDDEKPASKDKKEEPKSVSFFKLFSYADKVDYLLIALGTLGAFGHGLAFPIFFFFFGKLVNSFGSNQDNPQQTAEDVGGFALDLVYLGIVILGCAWAEVACWMHSGQRQASKMRNKYLQAILNQDVGFFDTDARTGVLVESISKDILVVQDAISEKVGNFLHFMATFVGGFGVGFSMQWKVCLVTVAVVPAIAFAGGLYTYTLTKLSAKSQEAYGSAGNIAEQTITQIRTVYSFAGEKKAAQNFSESIGQTLKLGYQGGVAKGLGLGVTYSILFFSWALILWYGGKLIRSGEADGGKTITAVFAAIIGGMSLGQAMSNLPAFSNGRSAAFKIFELINKPFKMDQHHDDGLKLSEVKGDIELRNVKFSYPSRPDVVIFQDFSISIQAGRTIALVGGSGSGKSTVVSLIERFYDPLEGQVLLDGVNICMLQLSWLRDQIGLVNQEPALFATTILGNILYGKGDATMEEVEAAAKAANAHSFISELPNGYSTKVGDRGVTLSGGQRQRVAIARAMLKNPKILLLDEATSALDAASERVVQDALDRLMVGRTTIIIAHRLSTIRNVDNIGVVQSGQIVEMGTHDELMAKGELGAYSTLVKLQEMALSSDGTILGRPSKASNSLNRASSMRGSLQSKSRRISSDRHISHRSTSNASEVQVEAVDEEATVRKERAPKGSYWRLMKLNAPEWPYAILGSIGSIMAGVINPIFALIISELLVVYYEPDGEKQKKEVQKYALVFVGVGAVTIGIYLLQHYFFGVVGENLTARVRELIFKAMIRNEVGWFDREENNSNRLTARLAVDASNVRAAIGDRVALILQNSTGFVTACVIGLVIEWRLALVLLATFPLLVAASVGQQLMVTGLSGNLKEAYALSSMIAGDAIGNIRTVAAFNAEGKVLALFSEALDEPRRKSFLRGNISGFFLGVSQCAMYSSYALVLWYGSVLVKDGKAEFGSVMKVFMVLMITAFAVAETLSLTPDIIKGSEAIDSVFEIIDRQTSIDPDDQSLETVSKVHGDVDLVDVEFAYPTRPDVIIFKGFNLSVRAGDSLALVGASGSGKSSVVGLVERFYDPLAGSVRIDGKDIRHLNLSSLRKHIGLVQQEPALFGMSIFENILYGRAGATEAEVEEAARSANVHQFISSLPAGYNTQVGERGVQLSGGQKQRVAIARAVLKNPAILLLDEATSALDAESEKVVQAALDNLMEGRTTIVVAHRLTTIRNANTIAVVQEGRILEKGSHSELMRKPDGSYARLVNIQRAREGHK
ncbi:hypothetical protein GOP47_0022743 [Adiantum capillus-veneris]|uniref:Uncharacterized protein n=1 Tax=Adiantum capillus-veneris TaxID=13818 RepID=A0A9D4U7X4_ADICA|nr:hypothetical protein GOP47_0022743 [Adiantum capillus-veneris]